MFLNILDFQLNVLTVLASRGKMTGRDLCHEVMHRMKRYINYGTFYMETSRMVEQELISKEDIVDEKGRLRFFEIADKGKSKRIEWLSDAQKKGAAQEGFDGIPERAKVWSR